MILMAEMGGYGRHMVINEEREGFRWMHSGGEMRRDVFCNESMSR